jgi:hypothetical protein
VLVGVTVDIAELFEMSVQVTVECLCIATITGKNGLRVEAVLDETGELFHVVWGSFLALGWGGWVYSLQA